MDKVITLLTHYFIQKTYLYYQNFFYILSQAGKDFHIIIIFLIVNGLLKGSILSADRIIRCNPSAYHYQIKINGAYNDNDGRLIDFVNPISYNKSNKSPTVAAILSLIPGLGRIYSGRFYDGLNSMITIGLTGKAAKQSIDNNNKTLSPILSGAFIMFYIADIYGGWRSAKYYQEPIKIE